MDIVTGILVGLFIGWFSFKWIFGDWAEFLECVKYWFTPDIISLFRGSDEYWRDHMSEFKLGGWFILAIGSGIGTAVLINRLFY